MTTSPILATATGMSIPDSITHAPPQGQWTVGDWECLPENGYRYEVLDGVLYMATAPSNFHQWVVQRFDRYVGAPAEMQGLAYGFLSPIGLIFPPSVALQPDYVLIRKHNLHIVRGGRIRGAPDLVAEVLSPSNTSLEMSTKRATYATVGIPEYVEIEPATCILKLYNMEPSGQYGKARIYTNDDTVTFACLPTIPLAVADLFADAPDTTVYVEE